MNVRWSSAFAGIWAGQLGGIASDPSEGDDWTHCSVCSRPTTMTGTKLCDCCWERQRRSGGSIESRFPGIEATILRTIAEEGEARPPRGSRLAHEYWWIAASQLQARGLVVADQQAGVVRAAK